MALPLPSRYLTPDDLVEMFELPSVETVYQWRRKRTGPAASVSAATSASTPTTYGPGSTPAGARRLPDGRTHSGPLVRDCDRP